MNNSGLALAIDIGGSKLAAALVDSKGRILARDRRPAPGQEGPEDFFQAVVASGLEVLRSAEVAVDRLIGVGCGCGGPMDWPSGVVSPLNIPAWSGFPLRERLSAELGLPILVHNDAVALAAGESWRGGAVGARNLLAVTVSTGVGGGLILDGRLRHGTSGNAGHIGHVIVEPGGPLCPCGAHGCLEAVASGPSAVRYAQARGWSPPAGAEADGRALAAAAAGGDQGAIAALRRAGSGLGIALASCAALLDLEVVVVAGGFSRSGPVFWEGVRQSLAASSTIPFASGVRVVPSELGDDAGLLGAASFVQVPDRYGW